MKQLSKISAIILMSLMFTISNIFAQEHSNVKGQNKTVDKPKGAKCCSQTMKKNIQKMKNCGIKCDSAMMKNHKDMKHKMMMKNCGMKCDSTMMKKCYMKKDHKSMMDHKKMIKKHTGMMEHGKKMKNKAHTMNNLFHEGMIDVNSIDKNKDGKVYQDMMDWNVISDKPGKCPICGMKLKEVSIDEAKKNLTKNRFKIK